MFKRWGTVLIVVMIVIAAAALLAWRSGAVVLVGSQGGPSAASGAGIAGFETATVERTTLYTTVDGSGSITGERTVTLSFGVGGTVEHLYVEVGDRVTGEQLLAELDTTDLEYRVAEAEQALLISQSAYDRLISGPTENEIERARAALARAEAQLASALAAQENARRQVTVACSGLDDAADALETAQEAYDDYVTTGYEADATFVPDPDSPVAKALDNARSAYDVAESQCEIARAQAEDTGQVDAARASVDDAQAALDALLEGPTEDEIEQAQAQLEQARIRLDEARSALDDARLVAPFDGIVTDVRITEGQSVGAGMAVITVVDDSRLHVDVPVDELDVVSVETGQRANVTLQAADDVTVEGIVTRIDPAGRDVQGIVTYNVRVDVTPTDEVPVLLGMSADVEIIVAAEENVLVVPTEAVQRDDDGNEFVLVRSDDGNLEPLPVTSGQTTNGLTAVQGDLHPGQEAYIPLDETGEDAGGGLFGNLFGFGRGR